MKSKHESILSILYRLHILSPKGLSVWAESLIAEGINLMALLRFAARFYPQRIAIIDGEQSFTYRQLYSYARQLAQKLSTDYQLRPGMSVAFIGRNSLTATLLLHALSRLGTHVTLLSTDLGTEQITADLLRRRYQFLVYDAELKQIPQDRPCTAITTESLHDFFSDKPSPIEKIRLPRVWRGREIIIHTGGYSGNFKAVAICHLFPASTVCLTAQHQNPSIQECADCSPFLPRIRSVDAYHLPADGQEDMSAETF